jgi:hypothetical protein
MRQPFYKSGVCSVSAREPACSLLSYAYSIIFEAMGAFACVFLAFSGMLGRSLSSFASESDQKNKILSPVL